MIRPISITRRLVLTVLVLELLSAAGLIAAITVHEREVQLKAFDSALLASAESLMGAVQDTEDQSDDLMLDMRGVQIGQGAAFRVQDDRGRVLGTQGNAPPWGLQGSGAMAFRDLDVGRRKYRFLSLQRLRIVDPGQQNGGVRHSVRIIYGAPVGHVWYEVFEAVRFFAIATALLLGVTAAVMAWLIRKELSPIRELARRAEGISSSEWHFDAPEKATHTVELKPLVAALEGALERLRRSFEQQRRFTNDAAHELKTDVAIVKSSLQLLSMRRRTVEEYAEGLAVSLEDFTRLQTTVQKMLTLARLEQPVEHSSPNETTPSCSLRDSMQEAVHQSKALADLKSIQVIVKFAANVIVAIDNRDALLLCSNIVLNALQHSPEGSVVQISMTVHEGQVQIAVQDQGEGISEGDRSHVFEPFYRGDQSRSRKSGGSGLGLSICKAICERSGGSIEIANHTEGGALVTAMLPLAATIPAALSEWRK